jgi:hypothetical protein
LATSSIGKTFSLGFGTVSPKKALVFSSTSSPNVSGFSGSAKRTSIPNCLKVFTNKFQVTTYRLGEETILSPALHRF